MNLRKTSKLVLKMSAKTVFWILCLSVFIFVCTRAFALGTAVFSNEGMADEGKGTEVTITIPAGMTDQQLSEMLKENGLIENEYIFRVQLVLYEAEYLPGDYVLNTEDGPQDIIELLRPEEES